jgi:hypothetical protein
MPDEPTHLPPSAELTKDETMSLTVSQEMASPSASKEVKEKLKAYNETVRRTPFPFPDYVKAAVDLMDASKSLPPNMTLTPSPLEIDATLLTNMAATLKQDGDGQQVLKQLLGSGSPCGQAHPEKVQGICTSLGKHGGDGSVASRETGRFMAEREHSVALKQVVADIDKGLPFNANEAVTASIQAIKAGGLDAHGDFVGEMSRITGRRRAGDDRPCLSDKITQEWLKGVLESDAFTEAVKVYPSPEVLRHMKTMMSLCTDVGVTTQAVRQFHGIANSPEMLSSITDTQKQKLQRLHTEVVQLRATVPVDTAGQLHAAQQALQNGNQDLVDAHVRDLLRTGNHDAIDLAGQIVLTDEFKKAFGTTETAEALVNVTEVQLVQPRVFGAGQIPTDRLLQAGLDMLPEKPEDVTPSTDVKPALRVVDLLAKRRFVAGDPADQAALKLLDHVFHMQNEVCKQAPALQKTPPQRATSEIQEFQVDGPDEVDEAVKLSQAEELQMMAQINRAYGTYFPKQAISHANVLSEAAKGQFQQALDTHNWNELVGLGEVADQLEWISNEHPKMKGELLTREQMINSALTKAEILWADVADPKKNLDLTDPANHEFMDALQSSCALASHNRTLCQIPLARAEALQQKVMLKQLELLNDLNDKVRQTVPDSDALTLQIQKEQSKLAGIQMPALIQQRELKVLELKARLDSAPLKVQRDPEVEKARVTYNTLRDLGQEIGQTAEIASNTANELDAIGGHNIKGRTVAELKNDVHRFQGELKTGLQYSRAFTYSSGSDMTEDDAAIVSDFAKQASFAVSEATLELMTNNIGHWDLGTKRMENHINRQANWEKSEALLKGGKGWTGSGSELLTARKALTNDMRLLAKYSEKAPTKTELKDAHREELAELLAKNNNDVDAAVKERVKQIQNDPRNPQLSKSADSLMGTFSKDAGYLVEERAYQLLQSQERTGWDAQNTTVIPPDPTKTKGMNTRPDLMQRLGGDKWVALDFTASKSSGHIFGKANAWVADDVTEVVEITYPSFDAAELERFMLEKAPIDQEAVDKAKRDAAERQKLVKETSLAAKREVRDLYTALRKQGAKGTLKEKLEKEGMKIDTISDWAGMNRAKYGRKSESGTLHITGRTSPETLTELTASVQALSKVAQERGMRLPPKVQQMARDGIQAYCVPPPSPLPTALSVTDSTPVAAKTSVGQKILKKTPSVLEKRSSAELGERAGDGSHTQKKQIVGVTSRGFKSKTTHT